MCASAGGEWECELWGLTAFKGFPPPEVCDYGFEKVLIGTRGARETFLQGRKGRAAKNSVLTSGAKQLKC